jgi:hypothetical protein
MDFLNFYVSSRIILAIITKLSDYITQKLHEKNTNFQSEISKNLLFTKNHIRKWKDNTKTNLTEIGCEDVDWVKYVGDRIQYLSFMDMIINFPICVCLFICCLFIDPPCKTGSIASNITMISDELHVKWKDVMMA